MERALDRLGMTTRDLFLVELGVPLGEVAETFAEGDLRGEAVVALKGGSVGIGSGDVTGLHGDELFVGLEVEVLGEDAGTDEFFLEDGDEVEEVLGLAATDVIHGIGWDGEAVVALLALGGALHHAYDAFYDVIDIGEVATYSFDHELLSFYIDHGLLRLCGLIFCILSV